MPFPIELITEEINQNPTPSFLSWNNWPLHDSNPSKYNIKKRKKRFWNLANLLYQLEDRSSIFICPFCEFENYIL